MFSFTWNQLWWWEVVSKKKLKKSLHTWICDGTHERTYWIEMRAISRTVTCCWNMNLWTSNRSKRNKLMRWDLKQLSSHTYMHCVSIESMFSGADKTKKHKVKQWMCFLIVPVVCFIREEWVTMCPWQLTSLPPCWSWTPTPRWVWHHNNPPFNESSNEWTCEP